MLNYGTVVSNEIICVRYNNQTEYISMGNVSYKVNHQVEKNCW